MTFTPREGMICITRDGRSVGPVRAIPGPHPWRWVDNCGVRYTKDGYWAAGGWRHSHDLVSSVPDEPALPVRTRTVTEIIPGEYDGILISEPGDYAVFIRMHIEDHGKFYDAAQLRAAMKVFGAMADALETTS